MLLLRSDFRAEVHRAGRQGVHCHNIEYDFVSAEPGEYISVSKLKLNC